jgi:tRNA-Thr(GGU) m(6)t(6)A37 methyltransferase TsaA
MSDIITLTPIGVIHSDHLEPEQTPIQPFFAKGCPGTAEVFPEYAEGLKDIEGFSHLILLYYFHRSTTSSLVVRPYLDDADRGIFATRHPCRPNPIGLSIVRLIRREGVLLFLEDVDILDGTPLLDIKPFFPQYDVPKGARAGWAENIPAEVALKRGRRAFSARKRRESREGKKV